LQTIPASNNHLIGHLHSTATATFSLPSSPPFPHTITVPGRTPTNAPPQPCSTRPAHTPSSSSTPVVIEQARPPLLSPITHPASHDGRQHLHRHRASSSSPPCPRLHTCLHPGQGTASRSSSSSLLCFFSCWFSPCPPTPLHPTLTHLS
jgi:hypothetical protein